VLVGRETECRHLLDLLDRARGGTSGVLLIRGEAGIGKSTLLDDVVAAAGDMTLLRVRGVESEGELPYAALHRLVRPTLHALAKLPARQADALRRALSMAPERGTDRFLIAAEQRYERADRGRHGDRIEQERHERARRQRAGEHESSALPEHDDHRRKGDEADDAEQRRAHLRARDRGLHDTGEQRAETARLLLLAHEALHRADLRERLVGHAEALRHPVLQPRAGAP